MLEFQYELAGELKTPEGACFSGIPKLFLVLPLWVLPGSYSGDWRTHPPPHIWFQQGHTQSSHSEIVFQNAANILFFLTGLVLKGNYFTTVLATWGRQNTQLQPTVPFHMGEKKYLTPAPLDFLSHLRKGRANWETILQVTAQEHRINKRLKPNNRTRVCSPSPRAYHHISRATVW